MKRFRDGLGIWVLLVLVMVPELSAYQGQALLDYARQERASRAQFAAEHGAEVSLTEDGKSFILKWFPPAYNPQDAYVIVSVGGHSTYAFDDFSVWYPFLKNRKFGLLALQWWFGENQQMNGYLTPDEMYAIISKELKKLNIQPGHVLLHGFSRGSANSYALAALDRQSGQNYFGLIIANSGSMVSGYPPNRKIAAGAYGKTPFKGTRWITFAGSKDPNPDRDGVTAMRATAEQIKKYGGTVVLAIEDPQGGHGGFHMHSQNAEQALAFFENNP